MYINGWIDEPDLVMVAASDLVIPYFSDTEAANLSEKDLPKQALLWKCVSKVIGKEYLPVRDQGKVGSCTGHGTCRAIEYTNIMEICNGDQEEFKTLSRILCYQGSRVVIGKNRFIGSDGSLGIYAAKFCLEYGLLDECSKLIDYSYTWEKCKEMQNSEVPRVILDFIKDHTVNSITNIKSWLEAKKSLSQGYGVALSARQGFDRVRNKDGVCKIGPNWNHCTALVGYMTIGGKEYGVIENSWGEYLQGPKPPENPNNGCFLADAGDIHMMLSSGDCWAFAGLNGFKKRDIDWAV